MPRLSLVTTRASRVLERVVEQVVVLDSLFEGRTGKSVLLRKSIDWPASLAVLAV